MSFLPPGRVLSRLPVIDAVRPHVGRRGETVGHVVEGGDRGDVPDVAIGEARAPQLLAVLRLDLPGRSGELHREIEHRALAFGKPRGAIVLYHLLPEIGIAEL